MLVVEVDGYMYHLMIVLIYRHHWTFFFYSEFLAVFTINVMEYFLQCEI